MMKKKYSNTGKDSEVHDRPSHQPSPTRAATRPTVERMPISIGSAKICRRVR